MTLQEVVWGSQIVTGLGTLIVLFNSLRLTRRVMKADVLSDMHRRFDQLGEQRAQLLEETDKARAYYDRFWSLQYHQFLMWQQGYADDQTFRFWLGSRHDEYHGFDGRKAEKIGDVTYQEGWEHAKVKWKTNPFVGLMTDVFAGHADNFRHYRGRKG
jgi:hypothetical protein